MRAMVVPRWGDASQLEERPAPGAGDPVNFFAGTNILSIVVELPVTVVTGGANANSGTIKTWVSTSRAGRIDRMAIPAINMALIPSAQKDAFNKGDPINDAKDFQPTAISTIKTLRGVVDGRIGLWQICGHILRSVVRVSFE